MRRPAEKRPRNPSDFKENTPPQKRHQTTPQSAGSDLHPEADINEYDESVKQLECELQKETPKQKIVRRAMRNTFAGRHKWIQESCPPVHDVLTKFPLLKSSDY